MKLKYQKTLSSVHVPYVGRALLKSPLLNKDSAFSLKERINLKLHGLLPDTVETIEEQVKRSRQQYKKFLTDIERHIYLRNIQDTNETLFYKLLITHLNEMLPIIYTPTVGEACKHFSNIYRQSRGLFISYINQDIIDNLLRNINRKNIKVIVVTDGERVLGLGDQGIGGINISIGKLSLYTACGGIDPSLTLPIVLDSGTNNKYLLNDPFYMGWRHPRIIDEQYNKFVDIFIKSVKRHWPGVLLQFEDFAKRNATKLLNIYRNKLCCFNDDIQGTAVVTLSCLIAANRATAKKLRDHTVVLLGAGSAGCGIAEQIVTEMCSQGLTKDESRQRIFMVDRKGLLTDKLDNLLDFQKKLVQPINNISKWQLEKNVISLLDVIKNAKPTILIGTSGQYGLFTEEVIREMSKYCKQPIIMPLSNPTSCIEATPECILHWTDGTALIATGSPFAPIIFKNKEYNISQCNNVYVFPGLGLGILASGAKLVTDAMLTAASHALAGCSPLISGKSNALLPNINDIQNVSRIIALAVGKAAQADNIAINTSEDELLNNIENNFWQPVYHDYYNNGI